MNVETKAVVTVSEMARMCGLSRARFYQLDRDYFPLACLLCGNKAPIFRRRSAKIVSRSAASKLRDRRTADFVLCEAIAGGSSETNAEACSTK